MTNIIELAKKVGFVQGKFGTETLIVRHSNGSWIDVTERIESLEQLIRADERELCAKVCEETDKVEYMFGGQMHDDAWNTLMVAAAAIRAR